MKQFKYFTLQYYEIFMLKLLQMERIRSAKAVKDKCLTYKAVFGNRMQGFSKKNKNP